MSGLLRRGLRLMLAMALVVAGLPVAHAMPVVDAAVIAPGHHDGGHATVASASHTHHCDDMAMDAGSASDEDTQPNAAAPCKCLNCSMCVANILIPLGRLAMLERRTIPVVYRIDATHLAGIAAPIDPGIPILAS